MFPKLLARLLALHLIMFIPGRSCDFWKELHRNSFTLYHSMQVAAERLENHIKTIDLLLQKFSNTAGCWMDEHLTDTQNWMEENTEALTKLVSDQAQSLREWLEKHTQDFSAWLNVNFGDLLKCQDTCTKDYGYELGTDILAHDESSEKPINQSDMWLAQHAPVALYKDLLTFFKAPDMYASNVRSSLEDFAHVHIQFLTDYAEMLEQLRDNCSATFHMLLEGHDTAEEAEKSIWDFFNVSPQKENWEAQNQRQSQLSASVLWESMIVLWNNGLNNH